METIKFQLFSTKCYNMFTKIGKFLLQNAFLCNLPGNHSSDWFESFETKQNKKSWIFAWKAKETVFSNSFHASMSHITNCTISKLLELKQTVSPSIFAFVQYPTWYAEFQCREEQGSSLYKEALDGTLTPGSQNSDFQQNSQQTEQCAEFCAKLDCSGWKFSASQVRFPTLVTLSFLLLVPQPIMNTTQVMTVLHDSSWLVFTTCLLR